MYLLITSVSINFTECTHFDEHGEANTVKKILLSILVDHGKIKHITALKIKIL